MKINELFQKSIDTTNKELAVKNKMAGIKIEKIVVSSGYGKDRGNKAVKDLLFKDLQAITGQKPLVTKAKKSIASFKVREGEEIGYKVTLRSKNMYNFLYKLIMLTLPSIRDFKGVPNNSFDGCGNYTIGIKDITVFPEISFTKERIQKGCEVTIIFNHNNKNATKLLLNKIGLPFSKEN